MKRKEKNKMKIFFETIVLGTAGIMAGMAHSTFRHYYHKYADIEDLKTYTIQDVNLISEVEGEA